VYQKLKDVGELRTLGKPWRGSTEYRGCEGCVMRALAKIAFPMRRGSQGARLGWDTSRKYRTIITATETRVRPSFTIMQIN
jgi:hypothetical protein